MKQLLSTIVTRITEIHHSRIHSILQRLRNLVTNSSHERAFAPTDSKTHFILYSILRYIFPTIKSSNSSWDLYNQKTSLTLSDVVNRIIDMHDCSKTKKAKPISFLPLSSYLESLGKAKKFEYRTEVFIWSALPQISNRNGYDNSNEMDRNWYWDLTQRIWLTWNDNREPTSGRWLNFFNSLGSQKSKHRSTFECLLTPSLCLQNGWMGRTCNWPIKQFIR
jgi:hypothetical protein